MPEFVFPAPAGVSETPLWTGKGFRLGDALVPLLEYSENFEGWSDELTALHEESAGDSHPIDLASREDALAQLRDRIRDAEETTILEVGCSSGFLLRTLKNRFPSAMVLGADVVREPLLELAKHCPCIPLMRFDLVKCPLPSETCDAVVMLNVLEHISDDISAMSQVHRILKPGGVAVVEVPAGPHLFDAYDEELRHFRRYSLSELTSKMRSVGFTIERESHLGFLVYPAFVAVKRRNQRKIRTPGELNSVVVEQASESSSSKVLSMAFLLEGAMGKLMRFPTGIRCLVVGRKV